MEAVRTMYSIGYFSRLRYYEMYMLVSNFESLFIAGIGLGGGVDTW